MPAGGNVPEDANENCPGTGNESSGKAAACAGCPNQNVCKSGVVSKEPDPDILAIQERMSEVKHKILVLSGKGGVGKSTFSAQLAFALAAQGKEVGLMDVDICGPSIPKMLGLEGSEIHQSNMGWSPVYVQDNLGVMSIGFMLPNQDDAVVWRGPRKNGLIKQFLKDVHWGALDYLIVDTPPGTSDEHISLTEYLKTTSVDGALLVTTPQEVAVADVRKEINFCKKVGIKCLGVVENMSGLEVPVNTMRFFDKDAGVDMTDTVLANLQATMPGISLLAQTQVFHASGGGGKQLAKATGVKFLGRVPLDPSLARCAEEGRSAFDKDLGKEGEGVAARVVHCRPALQKIVDRLLKNIEGKGAAGDATDASAPTEDS